MTNDIVTSQVMMMNLAVEVTVVDENAQPVVGAPVYFNVEKKCFDAGADSAQGAGNIVCHRNVVTDTAGRASFTCTADLRYCHVLNGLKEDHAVVEVTACAPNSWMPAGGTPQHTRYEDTCYILGGLDRTIPIVMRLHRSTLQP